ncbi:MAG: LCP family protein [Sporichthyaceae bacterium]|nr:LCP family protein [Sporichthyaceae bacterium]
MRDLTSWGRPRLVVGVAVLLAVLVALPIGFAALSAEHPSGPAGGTPTATSPQTPPVATPTRGEPVDPWAGIRRYTMLFLGGDGGDNRRGVRTDSVIVGVVDTATGNTTLIGVPRNLQRVRFRPGTPMAELFPGGFPDYLYGIYTYAEDHPDVVPGSEHPGADLLKDTIGYNLGLEIDHYALVNMAGFAELINALGGIQVRVTERIPIGGQKSLDGTSILRYPHDYIEPGLYRNLTGRLTLWFARSRFGSTDYARMVRQRCVLGAVARQIDAQAGLAVVADLSGPDGVLQTDVSMTSWLALAELAKRLKTAEIRGITLGPPLIDGTDPDWALVRRTVDTAIDQTRRAHRDPTRRQLQPANGRLQSLDSVCRYR